MTDLTAALEAYRPELEARFVRNVTRTIERLVTKFGADLRGVYNSSEAVGYQSVREFTTRTDDGDVVVHADRTEAAARAYAEHTVTAWAAKIEAKTGSLEGAEVVRGDGAAFTIRGTKDGRQVLIHQDMIVNVSPRGLLFNQFPARIYVEGKFTSAAKFAAL